MSTVNRKQIIAKQKKQIFAKPIVTKNPVFEPKQIEDFFTLFNLYADNRRQADVKQIVQTAKTLGYDKTHEFIFYGLVQIADELDGEWVGFEQFLTQLTEKIGHPETEEGRRQAFSLVDRSGEERLTFDNLKKLATMLRLNLNEDQISEAITSIAGKGKQSISWDQFNNYLAKKMEKKQQN